jgi:integrase
MAARDSFSTADKARLLAVLANQSPRDRASLFTGLDTGFRAHELAALKVVHVVLCGREIRNRLTLARRSLKFGTEVRARGVHSRTVPLTARLRAALREYLGARFRCGSVELMQPLFLSARGQALSIWQQARVVKRVAAEAGGDPCRHFGTHSMRKTFARKTHAAAHGDINVTR